MLDLETAIDITTLALSIVVVFFLIWVSRISRRDMLHSFALVSLITVTVFAAGKSLDVIGIGFFGTKVFSDILELLLMLGLFAAILSFYGRWRRENTYHP
jgi:uncharacterized membrane protein